MKKPLLLIVVLLLIASVSYTQDVLKPRIAVFPLMNPSNDMQVSIISENVKDTAELTFKMVDRYEVIESTLENYENTISWFNNYTVENSIDSIIFGSADIRDDGSIVLEMSVYSRGDGAVTMTEYEIAETVFDIFAASDRLLISMMETFSGMSHIGFGSIEIVNKGDEGTFSVFIDNVPVGENITELPKILNGDRLLRVEQARMLGPYIVSEEIFFLNEGEDKVFEISVPGFTDEEASKIAALENFIDKNWEKKYSSKKIDKNFEKLEELFVLTDYSFEAENKKRSVLEKKQDWLVQKQKWGIQKGLSILDKKLGIAGYGGFLMSTPEFTTDDVDAEEGNDFSKKFGASVSFNLLKHLALQLEYNLTEYKFKVNRLLTTDTGIINLIEIPVMVLLRMPNKVMSAYAGYTFMFKDGHAELEFEDVGTGDVTTLKEVGDELVYTEGSSTIFGALFEIPLNKSYFMFDFRYSIADDDWSTEPTEEVYPGYFATTVGYGLKFF